MSIMVREAFDEGIFDQKFYTNLNNPAHIESDSPYNPYGNVAVLNAYHYLRYNMTDAEKDDVIFWGVWMRPSGGLYTQTSDAHATFLLYGDSGSTTHLSFRLQTDGSMKVFRGSTEIGSTGVIWSSSIDHHYFEAKVTLHDTTGTLDIWVDGASVLSLTGLDTKNGGTAAEFDGWRIYSGDGPGSAVLWRFTDLYIGNEQGVAGENDVLGPHHYELLLPDGDGFYSDLTRSAGTTNAENVDEATPNGDTDYVEGQTGDRDTYTVPALATTSADIVGVQVTAVVRTTGGGGTAQLVSRIDSTDYDSADIPLPPGSFGVIYNDLPLNPDTAAAWLQAEVEGSEFGLVIE